MSEVARTGTSLRSSASMTGLRRMVDVYRGPMPGLVCDRDRNTGSSRKVESDHGQLILHPRSQLWIYTPWALIILLQANGVGQVSVRIAPNAARGWLHHVLPGKAVQSCNAVLSRSSLPIRNPGPEAFLQLV
jgi:hypothetical protein